MVSQLSNPTIKAPVLSNLQYSDPPMIKRDELEELTSAFYSASWIWVAENSTSVDAPPAVERAFRVSLPTPNGRQAVSALIVVSVDNNYSLYVNGYLVGGSSDWTIATIYNVTLEPTSNILAIRGLNFPSFNGGGPSPAAIIAAIRTTFSDGTTSILTSSDSQWRVSKSVPYSFERPSFNDSIWDQTTFVAKYGDGIWGTKVSIVPNTILQINVPGVTQVASQTVNNTICATLITPIPLVTSRPLVSTNSTTNLKPVGAIVGGVLGGVVLLIIIAMILLCLNSKHGRRKLNWKKDSGSHVSPFNFEYNGRHNPADQPLQGPQNGTQHKSSTPP
ncbi:hypothetical protein BDZ94DRAFT_786858 [Collybia nuda]|uniref:Uncharacterized protein n=1 Tax=Collybia nuda TaxID=64659 RepID=A0A9P5YIY3_9AGAR|nr:hypothetical protein BDZ94DRAFT_786858 [Collybia nuda]